MTGYRVFRGTTQVGTPTGTTYTDTGLAPGSYSYTVRAVDAAGNLSRPEQHRQRDRGGHDQAGCAAATSRPPPAPARSRSPGRPRRTTWASRLPGVPRGHADRDPRRGGHVPHRHGPRSRALQLHRAGRRCGGQPLGPQQHRERDRGGHDQADGARQPHGHRRHRPGRARLAGLDGQRGRHGLPGLPRGHADRDPGRGGDVLHRHGPRPGSLQLHGARDRRGRRTSPIRATPPAPPWPTRPSPTRPGNLTATAGTGQVALGWQASTDNVGVTGYQVFRGATQIATLGAAARSYTDTGLGPGRLQLHGAGGRRGREPLGPEQHGERHGAGHHQSGRAAEPQRELGRHRPRSTSPGTASTDNVGGDGLPRLPRADADREHRREPDVLHGPRPDSRHLPLRGARVRRRRQPLGSRATRPRPRCSAQTARTRRRPETSRRH